jgi:hypothetical protein
MRCLKASMLQVDSGLQELLIAIANTTSLGATMFAAAMLILGQYGVDRPVAVGFGTVLNLVTVAPLLVLGGWALSSHAFSVATWLRQPPAEELRAEQ